MADTQNAGGFVVPGFERVRQVFLQNFDASSDCPEVGAAFSVIHAGECVVDLYAGYADAVRTRPWQADTLVNTFSTTKGVAAICISVLEDRGLIDYDKPVAHYWPEFGASGKAGILVGTALSHQGGLSGVSTPLTVDDLLDWSRMTGLLAAQAPLWPPDPGHKAGYHAVTWGFIAGELVRRCTGGVSLQDFLRDEIAGPLDAQYYIGTPEQYLPTIAEMIAPRGEPVQTLADMTDILALTLGNPVIEAEIANRRDFQVAELAALNGAGTARGIARLYAPFAHGGTFAGRTLLSESAIRRAVTPRFSGVDINLGTDVRWGAAGFFGNNVHQWYGPSPQAFGHSGWGGSMGYADPDAHVSVGYVINQMDAKLNGDPRSMRLVDALYRCLAEL